MPLVTKAAKRRFVNELMSAVRKSMLAKVEHMPEEWDGIEIRQLLLDHVKANVAYVKIEPASRRKNYENEICVRNI